MQHPQTEGQEAKLYPPAIYWEAYPIRYPPEHAGNSKDVRGAHLCAEFEAPTKSSGSQEPCDKEKQHSQSGTNGWAENDRWETHTSSPSKDLKPDLILSDSAMPRLKRLESDAK